MGKRLYADGKYRFSGNTQRTFSTDSGLREGRSVKEGFLAEVMSRQKPKVQGGIRREGNVVPG